MPNRTDEIELYSEEVQDILGKPPRWLVRWGTTIIFSVVGLLLYISWMVSYPDIVPAPIMMTTPNAPSPVISRSAGRIDKLFFDEKDSISQGDVLGMIENTASSDDIFELEKKIGEMEAFSPMSVLNFAPEKNLQLGEISPAYTAYAELYEAYQTASASSFDIKKINQIRAQIQNIQNINVELNRQKATLVLEESLADSALQRQKMLFREGAVAKQDVENAETIFLQRKRTTERNKLDLLNNELRINDLNQQITTIQKNMNLTTSSKFVSLVESIKQLQAQIEQWKTAYLLTAPVSGRVSFHPIVEEKVYVEQQFEVATIVPPSDKVIGLIALQMKGSGKVKVGQKVLIKLDGFPYQEYGFVRGEIIRKSAIPRNDVYEVEVKLPEGLVTNRGEPLQFEQRIQGVAEIVTDNKSLLNRIFEQIMSAFETSVE